MQGPTAKQTEIRNYIESRIIVDGVSPSLRQIGLYFRFHSVKTVHQHLIRMEKKGIIRRPRYGHRTIEILPEPRQAA